MHAFDDITADQRKRSTTDPKYLCLTVDRRTCLHEAFLAVSFIEKKLNSGIYLFDTFLFMARILEV